MDRYHLHRFPYTLNIVDRYHLHRFPYTLKFLIKSIPNIKKTQLNIIPYIILGMIFSESCVLSDIAKVLKDEFSIIQHESVIRRITRFFSNKLFNPYIFYRHLIVYVLKSFVPKHSDKIFYITFDHMFSKHNYTVFMMTLRVGTFGIPIYFKCFKNFSNNDAFKLNTNCTLKIIRF